MTLAFAPAAHAVDWRFEPYLNASATYTDNARQSSNNPQNALILTETPGFTLHSEGSRRVQASLQYGLTGVERIGNDQNNDLYHNLNAVGKAELVKDFLFIDGNAHISQELISLFGSPADATVNNSNRTTVGVYSISPYIQQRLGTFAFAQARYTASRAIFQNNVAPNANSNSFATSLKSGTRFTDLNWGLNYSITKTQNRSALNSAYNTDVTFESASATVGYALTRRFRVFGTVGHDSNDYLSSTGTSGSFYSAGFGWSPTRLTSVEASVGERYFGRTYSFSGSHRTRLTRWTLRYSEDVSDISRLVTNYNDLQQVHWSCPASAQAILPGNATVYDLLNAGCQVDSFQFGSSVEAGVFISKLLTGGVTWQLGKADVSVTLSDLTRQYQLVQAQDRVQRASGLIQYHLTPIITANGGLSFIRNSSGGVLTGGLARADDIMILDFGINRRFTNKLNGALTFRRTQRTSNVANADYDEDSITASVNMRF
ncbi:MAG TPA: TIGR03016 family PEP-CTERM system-associated outer membrane protein [Thiobacillus sp.]